MNWVLILRGFDMDDQAILDVEQRIKRALPELEPRCMTVRESLYDVLRKGVQTPELARVVVPIAVPEHAITPGTSSRLRVRKGARMGSQ